MQKKDFGLNRLIEIMDELRVKCPWDKKQTLQTLRYLTIEEVYELSDAILKEDMSEIKNELGDLLLHIVFYSKIASEKNKFDIKDVISTICEKLIYRHPHIYKNTKVNDEVDVKLNWEKLKMKRGKKSVLEGVPKSLPSLVKAYRIQEKVKGIGFKWENKDQSWKKVIEEFEELKWANDVSVNVVLASKGYPGLFSKGLKIKLPNLDKYTFDKHMIRVKKLAKSI